MTKFKVGDKVLALEDDPKGEIGYIVYVDNNDKDVPYAVDFEGWNEGNDLGECGAPRLTTESGYWMSEYELELVEDKPTLEQLAEEYGVTLHEDGVFAFESKTGTSYSLSTNSWSADDVTKWIIGFLWMQQKKLEQENNGA